MASKTAPFALLLSLNLLFFSMASAASCPATTDFLRCSPVLVTHSYYQPCCGLFDGLLDIDAAVCLCAALKANILGIILDLDATLQLIVTTACGKTVPTGFKCTK